MRLFWLLSIYAALFRTFALGGESVTSNEDEGWFLWLSDIHWDPLYGRPKAARNAGVPCGRSGAPVYGKIGCDSPMALIQAVFQKAQEVSSSRGLPDFTIVTGDFSRHGAQNLDNPMAMTQYMLGNITESLQSTFPDTTLIPVLGNNDVTPDYYLDLEDPSTMLTMVTTGLKAAYESETEEATMLQGGYMARNLTSQILVVTLNTIPYSISHFPDQTHLDDPLGQFAWLETQLIQAGATGRVVYIMGHIPPSVGSYHRAQLWSKTYLDKYYSIIAEYSDLVAGQFFGHIHTDEFRLINHTQAHAPWPILMAPSITPIYGSNPSMRWVKYEKDSGRLLDYDTFYLDIAATTQKNDTVWFLDASFREAFNVPDLSSDSLLQIAEEMKDSAGDEDSEVWQTFLNRQLVQGAQEDTCTELCRLDWICTFQSATHEEYNQCLANLNGGLLSYMESSWLVWVATGLLAAGCLFFSSVSLRRALRRRNYQPQSDGEHPTVHWEGETPLQDTSLPDIS